MASEKLLRDWTQFVDLLRQWYLPSRRPLPWKETRDPYLIWVSEIFLQQTQADRVVDFFLRFTARFPTVHSLARSSFDEALPYFKGLGYYGRLRRMIETAKIVTEKWDGQFPNQAQELKKLPGIGEYTARALLSYAFQKQVLAQDTNVKRILRRYFNRELPIHFCDDAFPSNFNLNQALMDLGAGLCTSKNPQCSKCPLEKKCLYALQPKKVLRKISQSKIPRGLKKIVVGILIQEKRVLVSRRRPDQSFAGLLEFPGGKVEKGEDERKAMQREFREEVGVEVSVRPPFTKLLQKKTKQVLSFHRCRILMGEPRSMEGQELFWVEQNDLNPKLFLPANKKIIRALKHSRL